jgi:peptide/nickel transport system substrate-binding protein
MGSLSKTSALVHAGALCACLFAPAQAAAEKVLAIGIPMLPPTRGNPHQNVSLPGTLPLQAIFDSLVRIGTDGAAGPALATDWEAIDRNTWVLSLRRDVMFSNGESFDAAAVITAVDYLLSDAGKSETLGTHLSRIHVSGARALDSHRVEITTAQPNAILPIHLDFLRIPAPAHFAALGPEGFALDPIGTGPFVVDAWTDGQIKLIENETAWRIPKLDRVILINVPDQAARLQGLLSGSLDVAMNLAPEERTVIEAAGGRLISYANPNVSYLQFVTAKESPLTDVRVRRALNYAVNKQLILDVLFEGAVAPTGQIAHPQAFGYNPDIAPYPYDPDRAKALLAEAGYPNGFAMASLIAGNGANGEEVQQLIASNLARIGVHMEIQRTTFAKYLEFMYQTGYPDSFVAFAMVTSGFDPMHGFRTRSCNWMTPYYCDEAAVPMIAAAESAFDPEERRRLVGALLAYERNNPPGIFMWQLPAFDAVAARVKTYAVSADVLDFRELDVNHKN